MRLPLSPRARLAIAAVVEIALNPSVKPMKGGELRRRLGLVDRQHELVFIALVQRRVLASSRGPSGGYRLKRPAEEISAGEILRIADVLGIDGLPNTAAPRAEQIVTDALAEAAESFFARLDKLTIADLAAAANRAPLRLAAE